MITALIATLALAPVADLTCAVMGSPVNAAKAPKSVDYAGVRYPLCCGRCDSAFKNEPAKWANPKGRTSGYSLFDAVSGEKLDFKDAKPVGPVDANGVQFYFTNEANLNSFKENPDTYSKLPAKEAWWCGVMDHKIDPGKAGAYVDYEDTRYYVCCAGCLGKFKEDKAKYAKVASRAVAKTSAFATLKD